MAGRYRNQRGRRPGKNILFILPKSDQERCEAGGEGEVQTVAGRIFDDQTADKPKPAGDNPGQVDGEAAADQKCGILLPVKIIDL